MKHFRKFEKNNIRFLISHTFSTNHIGGVLLKDHSDQAVRLTIGLGKGLRTIELKSLYKLKDNNIELLRKHIRYPKVLY